MKVLIADDNQLIVEDYLDEMGKVVPHAQCIGTSRPKEVIKLFEDYMFDVVIMDIDMPEINGITLAKKILEIKPRTNIIYVTGYEKFALQSWETFASSFLIKPVSTDKFKEAFANLRHPVSKITAEDVESEYAGENVIGRKILKHREERNMTREELARELGTTVQTISRWENGKRIPDVITFLKLARILAVEPGELMY